MSRRRATSTPSLVTILWRDIPAQVTATRDGVTEKALLPNRFQVAIDRAAKLADKVELHAYIAEWRRIEQPFDGAPDDAVAAQVDALNRAWTRSRLAAAIRRGGLDDTPSAPEQITHDQTVRTHEVTHD